MDGHSEYLAFVAQKSRSFYWPLRLFPRDQAAAIARLYAFCRVADDWADEGDSIVGRHLLTQAIADLRRGASELPEILDFLELAKTWSVPLDAAVVLLEALLKDVGSRRVPSEDELMHFCYGVAGVVGLMLCPILGVSSSKAIPHAIDLGIAMQLTNIARDVVEDAERDRIYLPAAWIGEMSETSRICQPSETDSRVLYDGVTKILKMAEAYYASASRGFQYIPGRSRIPIRVASGFYRQIGVEVGRDVAKSWQTKVKPRRFSLLYTFVKALCTPSSKVGYHESHLHYAIKDLPGVPTTIR